MAPRSQPELLNPPRPSSKEVLRLSLGAVESAAPERLADAERLKEKARGLAEAIPPKLRLAHARAFCGAALSRYWDRLRPRCRQALRPGPEQDRSMALRGEALAIADALAEVAVALGTDEAGYLVGRTYAAMLPEEYRSAGGVFYTPPAIVDRLLDSATAAGVDWSRCRVLDPACGGGAFLGPVARRMVVALRGADRRVILRNIGSRLTGYEIDPFAAWMSAVFLDATLNEEVGAAGGAAFEAIEVCDSLTRTGDGGEFDLVIGNPPYGRLTLPPELRATFRRSLYGHANLYGIFLDLALRKAKAGGVIAYVTPTGFLSGEYFKNLRALLGEQAPPVCLDFISARSGVFDDVLQETLLAVFRKGEASARVQVNFVDVGTGNRLALTQADDVPLPEKPEQVWIVPRTRELTSLAARLRSMPARLSDWGYGVSTGPLVWNRFKEQLSDEKRRGAVPLIWAEAVTADGEFVFRAARRNHAPYFQVRNGDDALLVRRPCVLLQRTTAKEQARRLIAAELRQAFLDQHGGAVTVENHLNMVVPLTPAPVVETRALAAFLNSAAADRAFRCISGTVAVSAYELESMPLPPPWAMRGLSELLDNGGTKSDVESYFLRLYGER